MILRHARIKKRALGVLGVVACVLVAGCKPEPFEFTSSVTAGDQGRLAFWWRCLADKCSIIAEPVDYADLGAGPFNLLVEDIREDQSELPRLTFTSSDESKLVILGTGCNPSCATLRSFVCDDAPLECPSVHAYVLKLGFFGVGEPHIEARTSDGALYDAVVFPVSPPD